MRNALPHLPDHPAESGPGCPKGSLSGTADAPDPRASPRPGVAPKRALSQTSCLIQFVVSAHAGCEAFPVEFDHIKNSIAVFSSIEKGIASWRLQKRLFRKANLGRQLKTSRKVLAEFLAASKCSVRSTPTSDNRRGNKVDIFGVAAHDPVKVPLIPGGQPSIGVVPSAHEDMMPFSENCPAPAG